MEAVSLVKRVLLLSSCIVIQVIFLGCDRQPKKLQYNQLINGLEEGEWRKYYSNGTLMQQRFYEHGIKIGVLKAWWDNGKLQAVYRFKNGEYDGTCFEWNKMGAITKKMHYSLGYEEGEQRQWYDDGSVRSNYFVQKGRRFGLLGTKNCVNVKDSIDRY